MNCRLQCYNLVVIIPLLDESVEWLWEKNDEPQMTSVQSYTVFG